MATLDNTVKETPKLSHKQLKALWKKEKRKVKRQTLAQERDRELAKKEETQQESPSFASRVYEEEEAQRAELLRIEAESRRQHELWEWHEEVYKRRLAEKAEQAEKERLQKLEIERKIKEEWEERQKKEEEEEEIRKKKKEKQEELLRQARDAENKDSDWSNPLAPVDYGKERHVESCPFFLKVGACRFGDRCSRAHAYPDQSRTVLFTGMFRHFQLDQGQCEEYDTDIVLEYEDSEVYQKFHEFYEDTLPEFKAIGNVTQFKVCCNFQAHLRGNVYVSYSREDDALQALTKFNARWYGGKQMSGQFVAIASWRRAICGLFGKGRCPKGKECNFMHVFKNPSAEFNLADRDMEAFTPQRNNHHRHSNHRGQGHNSSRRSRSRSQDRMSSRSSYSRQRSRDRQSSYRSQSRSYRASSHRQRSRSRERSKRRSRSRESSRYRASSRERSTRRSNSKERSKRRSHSRERLSRRSNSRERSKRRSRSPSRGRHRSSDYRSSRHSDKSSSHQSKRSHSRETSSRSRSRSQSIEGQDDSKDGSSVAYENLDQYSSSNNAKEGKKKKSTVNNSVRVDNIENYEMSVTEDQDNTEFVWVEKTTDTTFKQDKRSRSTSESDNSDCSEERKNRKRKRKKSKKQYRSKD